MVHGDLPGAVTSSTSSTSSLLATSTTEAGTTAPSTTESTGTTGTPTRISVVLCERGGWRGEPLLGTEDCASCQRSPWDLLDFATLSICMRNHTSRFKHLHPVSSIYREPLKSIQGNVRMLCALCSVLFGIRLPPVSQPAMCFRSEPSLEPSSAGIKSKVVQ